MIVKNKLGCLLTISIVSIFLSCKNKKDDDVQPKQEFDRAAMLTNISENIILNNYAELKLKSDTFNIARNTFISTSDSLNLVGLRSAFVSLYKQWQFCSVFELGPAENEILRGSVNTFPTDTVQINNNILSGVYNLSSAANIDAKGFPAIDYLLFKNNISVTLHLFTAHANAVNRKNYLNDLASEINTKINTVYTTWNTTYKTTFVSNTGTDIGSSTGMLVNQLCFDLEGIKNAKVGIPAGKKTLGIPVPDKTEAYYNGSSVQLALLNLQNLENVFLGKSSSGIDGVGFEEYLYFLNTQYNGTLLADKIKNQFIIAKSKLQAVPDPLSLSVTSAPVLVDSAYVNLQKLVVLLKTDMTSALGVQITYQDNDGD